MNDFFYEQASTLINNDNIKQAIPLLKKSLLNRNFDSAYRLGLIYIDCYEELGLKEPNYDMAIHYFQTGALNGHSLCQKELGIILATGPKQYHNYPSALRYILLSKNYDKYDDVDLIMYLIKMIYKNWADSEENDIKKAIKYLEEISKITTNEPIAKEIKKCRYLLIKKYVEKITKNCSSYQELIKHEHFFSLYLNKSYIKDVASAYLDRKIDLFLDTCPSIQNFIMFWNNQKKFFKNVITTNHEDKINLFLARYYRDNLNTDLALNYYNKIQNATSSKEKNELLFNICDMAIKSNDFNIINKYKRSITDSKLAYIIDDKIKVKKHIEHFNIVKEKADTGDRSAKIELAKLYKNGHGTRKNLNMYIEIMEELLYSKYSVEILTQLFEVYKELGYINKIKELDKYASKQNIPLGALEPEIDYILRPYAKPKYDDVKVTDETVINTKDNIIYHLYDYYKKIWSDIADNKEMAINNYEAFISIKNKVYNPNKSYIKFHEGIELFLNKLSGDWIICAVPGHEQSKNNNNGVFKVINVIPLKENISIKQNLILRSETVEKKSMSAFRSTYFKVDMKSLAIDSGFDVTGKCIIVIDDITTSGSSLIACRNILMDAGAKEVVLLALGKTKEVPYDVYFDNYLHVE